MLWKRMAIGIGMMLASLSFADSVPEVGETIQIYTQFREIVGKPSWLLILRDENTGQVLPYVYDIQQQDNFWLALSPGHSYRITNSSLKFDPFPAKIKNFCHLENGILNGISMVVNLSGDLTPNRRQIKCHVSKYAHGRFSVAEVKKT